MDLTTIMTDCLTDPQEGLWKYHDLIHLITFSKFPSFLTAVLQVMPEIIQWVNFLVTDCLLAISVQLQMMLLQFTIIPTLNLFS